MKYENKINTKLEKYTKVKVIYIVTTFPDKDLSQPDHPTILNETNTNHQLDFLALLQILRPK